MRSPFIALELEGYLKWGSCGAWGVGREPDVIFGAKESVVEAAYHEISSAIVSVDGQIPRILERPDSEG